MRTKNILIAITLVMVVPGLFFQIRSLPENSRQALIKRILPLN